MTRLTEPLINPYTDKVGGYIQNKEVIKDIDLKGDKRDLDFLKIMDKLGQLEDIEEKIKCPLEVFFQIFRKGIYVKSDCTKGKIEFWHPQQIKIIDAGCQWDICKINSTTNKYVGCFNYKKTWALTKEELEND